MQAKQRWIRGLLISTWLVSPALAADWPGYRGPGGSGTSADKIQQLWPEGGPRVLWKMKVGAGLGSFAIKGGRAFFLAAQDQDEACFAVELRTGKSIWTTGLGPTFTGRSSGQGGPGPASTPAVDGDRVYAYGSLLTLTCLNAADGAVLWQHDIQAEFDGQGKSASAIQSWGSACSPIVAGDLVIVPGGGKGQSFIAFNKESGQVVWKNETETLTHATPTAATIAGVRQVIFLSQSGLVSLEAATGKTLWKQPYKPAIAVAASPVVSDDTVYCSIGYNVGAGAFRVSRQNDGFSVAPLWRTPGKLMNAWSTPVCRDGYLYMVNGHGAAPSLPLVCVELATGKLMWTGPGVGAAELILADGRLIVQAGDGKLILVDPDPKAYKEISTAKPLSGQAWNLPALGDGVLLYRTNTEAAAIDLNPGAEAAP